MKNILTLLKNKILVTIVLLTFCAVNVSAQNAEVTGIVKEKSNGQPLPGVSVIVKGTQTGVITDADGRYVVSVSQDAILVFSFIGYENAEVSASGRTIIDVELTESLSSLDEVVVIGYGTTTKKELTGAVTSIKSKDFTTGSFNDPMGLVQGKVAGLSISKPNGADPLARYQILLRGVNSLQLTQTPLVIIDGVIDADLNNINFQDVESFDVLKDGSAAAIYGTRGTNGVIIITTKSAKAGKPVIDYSAQVSVQVNPRGVENLSAKEFENAINTYQPSKASGSLFGSSTNWFKEVTREAPISYQQNIALSGGADKLSHRTSITHSTAQGLLDKNQSERLLLKTNINQKAFDDRLTLSLNMTNSLRKYSPANYEIFRQAFIQNPTQPVYDDSDPETGGYSYKQGLEYYNPVAMLNERTRDGKTNDLVLNLRATVKILDGLTWENFVSTQKSDWEENSYKTRYYPTILGVGGEAEIANGRNSNSQFETSFHFNESFGDHNLEVLGGYSYQQFEENSSYVGNSDFDTDVFSYNNISAGAYFRAGNGSLGSYREKTNLIALFGRVMYNYKEKYLASFAIRREGSSKFGANNKWGTFPSLSVGWRLSEEAFIKDIAWIDNLKFRAGYGVTGNQGFGPYRSLLLLGRIGSLYYNNQWINSYGPGQTPNPDLRWETKHEINIGIDFGVLNNRLTGSLDTYMRKSVGLLWDFPVTSPPYLSNRYFTNIGTISNRGIELTLNAALVKKANFQWNAILTASHNSNKLNKLSNAEFKDTSYPVGYIGGTVGVYSQLIEEGKQLGTFYGPVWLGLDENGNDTFKNANPVGEVDKDDWERLGSAYPIANLGLTNTFSYKNWNLSLVFRSGLGGKVMNTYRLYYESWTSIGLRNVVHTQLDNPNFDNKIVYSSKYLENATFLKLDNVTLGYNFNIESKYITRLNAYLSAQNVFWITGYKGIDPEVSLGGIEPGIDGLSYYPRTTSLTLGVNASF